MINCEEKLALDIVKQSLYIMTKEPNVGDIVNSKKVSLKLQKMSSFAFEIRELHNCSMTNNIHHSDDYSL